MHVWTMTTVWGITRHIWAFQNSNKSATIGNYTVNGKGVGKKQFLNKNDASSVCWETRNMETMHRMDTGQKRKISVVYSFRMLWFHMSKKLALPRIVTFTQRTFEWTLLRMDHAMSFSSSRALKGFATIRPGTLVGCQTRCINHLQQNKRNILTKEKRIYGVLMLSRQTQSMYKCKMSKRRL
jgi:hypothetical protein